MILTQRRVIEHYLSTARDPRAALSRRRAAVWSLGHIAATELGCNALLYLDPSFIDWCIEVVRTDPSFTLRGTVFIALGLISRSNKGSRRLLQSKWTSAPSDGTAAVAIPSSYGDLFVRDPSVPQPLPTVIFNYLPTTSLVTTRRER